MARDITELQPGDIIKIEQTDADTGESSGYSEYMVINNYDEHIEFKKVDGYGNLLEARHDRLNDWYEATSIEEIVQVVPVVEEFSECTTSVFHIPLGRIILAIIVLKIVMYILIIRSAWVNRKIVFGKLWVKKTADRLKEEFKSYFK